MEPKKKPECPLLEPCHEAAVPCSHRACLENTQPRLGETLKAELLSDIARHLLLLRMEMAERQKEWRAVQKAVSAQAKGLEEFSRMAISRVGLVDDGDREG